MTLCCRALEPTKSDADRQPPLTAQFRVSPTRCRTLPGPRARDGRCAGRIFSPDGGAGGFAFDRSEHDFSERESLAWVARGKTNREIAAVLYLAPGTVRKHLDNVYAKLDVGSRAGAVARAFLS
jgi:DNA-binding CsgD family transcriptional regulator